MTKYFLALICATVFAVASAHAALLGTYDFESGTGAVNPASHLTFGAFGGILSGTTGSRVTGGGGAGGTAGYFTSSGYQDPTEYVAFTLLVDSGFNGTLTSMTFNYQNPAQNSFTALNWGVYSGGNLMLGSSGSLLVNRTTGGAWPASGSVNFGAGVTLVGGTTYEVRFSTLGGNSASDFNFDNVALNGATPVPEPVNVALGVFGLGAVGAFFVRRFRKLRQA